MAQLLVPEHLLNDLRGFIVKRYPFYLPNSLLIAQEFIIRHQNYGRELGLPAINYAIEEGVKHGLF